MKAQKKTWIGWAVLTLVAAGAAAGAAALLVNVWTRQQEGRSPYLRVVELTEDTDDPSMWGKNFPQQYDDYKKTVDQGRTLFGGSEAVRRTPTAKDPRATVAQSRLDEDPRLALMWAGYAFAKDFREERGHAYMLDDQTYTERQHVVKQPGTCVHCHASAWKAYRRLGDGDVTKGFEAMNKMPYVEVRKEVEHPVACVDCHEPKTMELRITRPAFMEGMRRLKASEGVADYDVNKMATHQEKRAFVCGQCHVEYYFKGEEKRLYFPWDKGLGVEKILSYYEEVGHKDWVHADTGAPALKAQHPEFEMWSQGVHAKSGVTCADCHMPYKRVGAAKVSDHHVQSPMLNINRACQTCHKQSEGEILARVDLIQSRTAALRDTAMNALMALIDDLKAANGAGRSDEAFVTAQGAQRRAQFLLDFVEAENSSGFHAPQEAMRILGQSIDASRQGQVALLRAAN